MENKPLIFKYNFLGEGETEKLLFTKLKTDIFRSKKLMQCKIHKSKTSNGTIPIYKMKDYNCCLSIYMLDKADVNDPKLYESKSSHKNLIIISNPFIEIVFYALFNVCEAEMDKQTCFNKLLKELNKYNIDYDKKEKVKFVDKFINLLNNEDNLNK